jgi:hypothetical protein
MAKTKRVSISIGIELLDDLNFLCSVLQVSRSSLVTEILIGATVPMREVIELSIPSAGVQSDKDVESLSRNPEKVRTYLTSLQTAIEQRKTLLDTEVKSLFDSLEATNNAH